MLLNKLQTFMEPVKITLDLRAHGSTRIYATFPASRVAPRNIAEVILAPETAIKIMKNQTVIIASNH